MQYRRDIGRKALAIEVCDVIAIERSQSMKYAVITFGCRVNQADSLGFEEDAARARRARRRRRSDADLVVVNTCSVTASADQGARQTIRRVARVNPGARIVVTGCYATRRPGRGRRRCRTSLSVVAERRQAAALRVAAASADLRADDGRAVRRRRRQLRRGDRAGRGRPHGVHAARADRLRRAVLLLHHPDDARRAAERADRRRRCARSSASPPPASRRSR